MCAIRAFPCQPICLGGNVNVCFLHLQVFLNQVALGPLVTSVAFTWNLLLQEKASEIPQKLKQDLVPTMVNGTSSRLHQLVLTLQFV